MTEIICKCEIYSKKGIDEALEMVKAMLEKFFDSNPDYRYARVTVTKSDK